MRMINEAALRERAEAANCSGIIALIDFLQSKQAAGDPVLVIGSMVIDFESKVEKLNARDHTPLESSALISTLPHLLFGSWDGRRSPLSDVEKFFAEIERLAPDQRTKFDRLCLELVREDIPLEISLARLIVTQPVP